MLYAGEFAVLVFAKWSADKMQLAKVLRRAGMSLKPRADSKEPCSFYLSKAAYWRFELADLYQKAFRRATCAV